MKTTQMVWPSLGVLGLLMVACGAVKEKAAEVSNELNVKGHWLMTESEQTNQIVRAVEKESMVLTFKEGKAAFAPTNSVKGQTVYAALSPCSVGPRPYRTEKSDLVFEPVANCAEKRVTVKQLDGERLKFSDIEKPEIVRTFVRIDQAKYEALVKPADRKP